MKISTKTKNTLAAAACLLFSFLHVAGSEYPPADCILINNPGFENGETGWWDDGTNCSVTTSDFYSGTSALRVVGDGAYTYQSVSVSAGSTYELTAWVKTTGSPTYGEIFLQWKTSGNTTITDILQPVIGASNWKQVTLKGKAPANAAYAVIGAYKQGSTSNLLYVDDFCLSLTGGLGGTIAYEACGCGENRVPNGGYEEVVDTLTFPLTIQGKPCKAMQNGNDWAIRPWTAGISSTHMFYVKDVPNTVNNPEGDYFVWLPGSGDCWISNVHFGNNLELEDGEQYTFCFYAASWVNNLNSSGLPTTGTPTQKAGILDLEFNINGTVTSVEEYSIPASESFSNLSWTKYTYTFTYSALQTISGIYFTNARTGVGLAIDAVSLSKVSCPSERPDCPSGSIGFQRWYNISGTRAEDLTSDANYPNNFAEVGTITSFQGASNFGNDYGTRVYGYIVPPATGNYTFTVTSTDRSELYLSTDADDANKALIAYVPGSTGVTEYTKYAAQTSSARSLTAGQKYYVELIHKAGNGTSDHFQVYWQTPSNSTRAIIPGSALKPACYDEICFNDTDDDFDGAVDCSDSECSAASTFSVSTNVTDETCGGGGGAIDLSVSEEGAPYAFRWSDMAESAWWTFEKNTQDVSGNNRHDNGVTGTLVYSSDAIEGRYSAYFDGNTYIRYSVDNGFMEVALSSLTVSMWIKPDNLTGQKTLFEEGGSNTNTGRGLAIRLNNNLLEASIRNGSNTLYTAGTLTFPNDGEWHHVAVVYNAGALTAFLDGVAGATTNTGQASIGAHSNNGGIGSAVSGSVINGSGTNYKGKMDDVRYFFNTALSASKIAGIASGEGDRSNLVAGNYSLTVSNASGCTLSQTIAVNSGGNFTSGGTIGSDESSCGGASFDPSPITSIAVPSGGSGGTTEYKWQRSTNNGSTWTDITSTNTATYDPPSITANTLYRRAARRTPCNGWVYSNAVTKSLGTNLTGGGSITGTETSCGVFNPTALRESGSVTHASDWNFKIDPPANGTSNGLTYTLTYSGGEPMFLNVTGDLSNVLRIEVKGGTGSEWYYEPPFTNMRSPINPNNGTPYGISHFTFYMRGGAGTTEYIWQRTTDGGTTWENIDGATGKSYDPSDITVTTGYRRGARRGPCQSWLYTNVVYKTVTGGLSDPGIIVGEEENCGSFDPDIIASVTPASGSGNPTIEYKWQFSTDGGANWTDIAGTNNTTYNPPTIVQTTKYRRGARSSTCANYVFTAPVQKMVALNITSAGSISGDQTVCGSYDATIITSTAPASGGIDGYLTYRWQQSTDGGATWTDVAGGSQETYDPPVLTLTTQFRRQARRTPCSVWVNSNTVTKTVRTVPFASITEYPATFNGYLCERTGFNFTAAEGGAGATYAWTFGSYASPLTANGKGPHTISFDVPNSVASTNVSANLTVSINGCVQTDVKTFSVRPQFQLSSINYTDPPSCSSTTGSFTINGTYPAGTSFEGSKDGTNFTSFSGNSLTFSNLPAGVYPVYVRYSGDECQQTLSSVTLSDPPDPSATLTISSTSTCLGTSITVSGTPDNGVTDMIFNWNFGAGASPATATGQGPHTVNYSTAGAKTISAALQVGACYGYEEEPITVVGNFTNPGTIIGEENMCSTTTNPANISSSASPSGGSGGSTVYKWQRRTSDNAGGWNPWTDISGATGSSYNPPPISVSTQYRRGARRSPCSDWVFTNEVTKSLSSMPIAVNDYYSSACPGFIYFNNVSYNDMQLQSPVYTLLTQPFNGTVDMDTDGEFVYTPNSTFCGTDQFSYRVCNQYSGCCQTSNVVIDLSDPEAPVLHGIPADVVVHCDEEVPLPPLVEAYENCQSVTLGMDQVSTQGNDSCSVYSYDLTRIWTGIDYCGNSAVDQQMISILDQTAPDIYRVYVLPNGKKMVAGVMENVTRRWKTIGFPIQFSAPPVVFAQVVSKNDAAAVVTRLRNVSTSQFQLRLQEEENADGNHLEENVAWIAIESGAWNGAGGGLPFEVQSRLTNSTAINFPLSQTYSAAPGMIGTIQTFNENNAAALRFSTVTASTVTAFIQEEQSFDAEMNHGFETTGYLALGGTGDVKTATGEVVGETGRLTLDHNFQTITLQHVYHNPVVVLGGLTYSDNAPATLRVQNLTSSSFSVHVDEWDYLDGTHGSEQVTYLVIEGSLPFDRRVECSSIPAPLGIGTEIFARDNCDQTIALTMMEDDLEFECGSDSLFTRTWSVRDECGNYTVLTQTFILTDTTPPTFSVPENVELLCSQHKDDLNLTGDVTDESDNCSNGINATYFDNLSALEGCFGFITRTWTLSDHCGNTTIKVQHLYVSPDNDGDLDMRPDISDWDDDNDGIPDIHEGGGDADGDGIPNYLDRDNDNDGITDLIEAGYRDFDGDGRVDNYLLTNWDNDGDGYALEFDANDGDPSLGASVIFNPAERDLDGDGIPNYFDRDSDGDGIPDIVEAGGADANGDGEIDYQTVGDPTSMLDDDGDGLANEFDSDSDEQTGIENATAPLAMRNTDGTFSSGTPGWATDTDGDGIPDFLDRDSDNDGIPDLLEAGGVDENGDGIIDPANYLDLDSNGLDDIYEILPLSQTEAADSTSAGRPTDENGDGSPYLENDADLDGIPNSRDFDADNDGIPDLLEVGNRDLDPNGDGKIDVLEDADGDGCCDSCVGQIATEADGSVTDGRPEDGSDQDTTPLISSRPDGDFGETNTNPDVDDDGDGIANFLDSDSDGDLVPDLLEDENGDGIVGAEETAALHRDTDLDGVEDGVEDANQNGNYEQGIETDPTQIDTDNDGFTDGTEDDNFNGAVDSLESDPRNPCDPIINPACIGVRLGVKVKLAGAMMDNGGSQLMRDDLRTKGLIPLQEPYSNMASFGHRGEGGGETISPQVLAVSGENAIVDWVYLELRPAMAPNTVEATRSALLQRDGDVVDVDGVSAVMFENVPSGSYYIVVRHRNHLGVATGTALIVSPNSTQIDYTSVYTPSYDEYDRQNWNGILVMWVGDLNHDRRVIYQGPGNDVLPMLFQAWGDPDNTEFLANFISEGYYTTDLNLDGKTIYQGPNNDRARLLNFSVMSAPENAGLIANFVLREKLP